MKQISYKKNTGFTLLEVLTAIILLSFGLLGVAGMQVKTQQFNRAAYFETQAIFIAHDMLERMRSNVAGQESGYYHLPTPTKHDSCYTTASCSTLEMAQNDLYEWEGVGVDSISTKLPSGAGVVCLDSTPDDGTPQSPKCDNTGGIYAVKVWWQASEDETRRAITTAAFK